MPMDFPDMIDIELYNNVRHQYGLRLQEIESLRAALEEIRNMATARKSCIRMPDGRMLDTFCRHALSPNVKLAERPTEANPSRTAQRNGALESGNGSVAHPGVWCCEKRGQCKWKCYALEAAGLQWGTPGQTTDAWRKWHKRECGGRLVQLVPQAALTSGRTENEI